jgi:hypothetical protein
MGTTMGGGVRGERRMEGGRDARWRPSSLALSGGSPPRARGAQDIRYFIERIKRSYEGRDGGSIGISGETGGAAAAGAYVRVPWEERSG